MESFVIKEQTHTLACLLRTHLFENGATFASCTVPHPLDNDLIVKVSHPESCKECLLSSLRDARRDIEQCINTINAYKAHVEATYMDVES